MLIKKERIFYVTVTDYSQEYFSIHIEGLLHRRLSLLQTGISCSFETAHRFRFLLKRVAKGGVMIPFHAPILTKFTRHVQF